jgi:hypothetical protein
MPTTPRRSKTHQRRIITKLKNNPAAREVEDLTFDGTAGAVFERPADLISFRSGRRKLSPEQRKAATANLHGREQRLAVLSEFPGRDYRFSSKALLRQPGGFDGARPM